MFKLIKIYVVEYLSTVRTYLNNYRWIQNFSELSNKYHCIINIYKYVNFHIDIKKIVTAIKRIMSLQGVTMPNCLHIVDFLHESKFVDLMKLVEFINQNQGNSGKNVQSFYIGL